MWFRFGSREVWLFYRYVRAVAESGQTVGLEWLPLPEADEDLAMSVYLSLDDPNTRGRFLHAMLGLVHIEERSVADESTVLEAITAAGVDVEDVAPRPELLDTVQRVAEDISVVAVPSLYRHGPPMRIALTPAALVGDPSPILRTILEVSEQDGIWELSKP